MASDRALADMPTVFTTQAYQHAAGLRPSSAPRALRRLEQAGAVLRLMRSVWMRDPEHPPAAGDLLVCEGAAPWCWSPGLEVVLQAAYGERPRRISHLTAVGAAGVALTWGIEVTVGSGDAFNTRRLGFRSRSETPDTLLVGAERVTEHTWISSPGRALLDCARAPDYSPRYEEHFGRSIADDEDVFCPYETDELAARLRLPAAMRRLVSTADGLCRSAEAARLGYSPDGRWSGLLPKARRGDRWIHQTNAEGWQRPACTQWEDAQRKVCWLTTPDGLADVISQ